MIIILFLTGNLKNLNDSTLVLIGKIDTRNFFYEPVDSVYSNNNQFEFGGPINKEDQFLISFRPKILNDSLLQNYWKKKIYIYLDGVNIKINGDFNDKKSFKIEGSPLTIISQKFGKITEKYSSQMKEGQIDLKDYIELKSKKTIDLIFKNPNNSVSLSNILFQKDKISKDSLKLFYSKLDKNLQNSTNGIGLNDFITVNKLKIGDSFIDFEAKDLDGKTVKLSDFNGKIVILDFWAYWCHWCHIQNQEEFPILKEKYKDLVIVSYSVDVDKKLWEQSSKKDKIDWINISNLNGITDKVALEYDVQGYPSSFLIDQIGIIRDIFLGYKIGVIEKSLNEILEQSK
jgi:peroxiredoxin